MPSDESNAMDNPDFSPRQLERLDEILERKLGEPRPFNPVQLAQLEQVVAHTVGHAIRASEERQRDYMKALLDPHHGVPERVQALEAENLPARVAALESDAPPPKRQRRRG